MPFARLHLDLKGLSHRSRSNTWARPFSHGKQEQRALRLRRQLPKAQNDEDGDNVDIDSLAAQLSKAADQLRCIVAFGMSTLAFSCLIRKLLRFYVCFCYPGDQKAAEKRPLLRLCRKLETLMTLYLVQR